MTVKVKVFVSDDFFLEMNIIYLPLNMNKVGDVVSELQKIQQYYLFYVDIY